MRILYTLLLATFLANPVFSQKKSDKLPDGLYAEVNTNKGQILIHLLDDKAPMTVANFVGLAEGNLTVLDSIKITKPYYDGVTFHRVIKDFMIQGGDPTATGGGDPGYKFFDEADNGVIHERGVLSMANAGPNTNGSQFFITHVETPWLNGKHTVFGKVLEGMEVVDAIQQGDTMNTIKIKRIGKPYKKYNATLEFSKVFDEMYAVVAKEQLEEKKLRARNAARVAEAKGKTQEEYKEYFYKLIKEMEPNAIQTESGLVYVVRQEGTGEHPQKGDRVSLHYNGTLVYGGKFDSSYDRNQPLDFDYLVTGLIPGFNEGVGLSQAGMKIDLYLPYYLAYGATARPPMIPEYSDLIFSLEILNIQGK
ncbi:MAG: peptidylprolyl isomerase [Brumimicrobium sp.]|nr:peptidylprolyl isomerase [Brumimicrobium sp.]